jgi:hypothetical protein
MEGYLFTRGRLRELGVSPRQNPFNTLAVMPGNPQQYQSPDLSLPVLYRGYVALRNADRHRNLRLLGVKTAKLTYSTSHDLPIDQDGLL